MSRRIIIIIHLFLDVKGAQKSKHRHIERHSRTADDPDDDCQGHAPLLAQSDNEVLGFVVIDSLLVIRNSSVPV
jgi:hypothetical protein